MERSPKSPEEVHRQKEIKSKFNATRELFGNNDSSHQNKKENIIKLYKQLSQFDEVKVKKFLGKTERLECIYTYLEKKYKDISNFHDEIKNYQKILEEKYPSLYKSLIDPIDHLNTDKPIENEPYSMKLAKALEKLRQEHNNDPNLQEFSKKIESLAIKYNHVEKLNKKMLEIENFDKRERQKLFDNYSDLCEAVGGIDNLINRIRDIKAPASNPKPEIQAMTHEMQDGYKQLKAELDKLREENQILKGQINKLENKEAEALTEEHPQIKELKQEIERLKAQVADLTKPNEVDNTKEKTGFFKKLKIILNKIKEWLKSPFAKNSKERDVNAQIDQPTKFGRVKKVFKVIREFLRKVAKYTGLLRFARTFPYRYRKNSTWGKIGKGTLEVLGGIVLAGGVYMVPFYIYKTAKYNHKDVMHKKYGPEGDSSYHKGKQVSKASYILKHEGEGIEFYIRDDIAEDRELAFLTRHPISNTEKQDMMKKNNKQDYENKKDKISKLTKAEVKILRMNENDVKEELREELIKAKENITSRTGWHIDISPTQNPTEGSHGGPPPASGVEQPPTQEKEAKA